MIKGHKENLRPGPTSRGHAKHDTIIHVNQESLSLYSLNPDL